MNFKDYILSNITKHPNDIVQKIMQHFGVTRTTALRHMQHRIKSGDIIKTGTTKNTSYALATALQQQFTLPLSQSFDEFSAYTKYFEKNIAHNTCIAAQHICEYGLTEMLNNCKDHSQGKLAHATINIDKDHITCIIQDDGMGVFATLGKTLGYNDPREIMLELSKGKLTRDPSNHTGEGIFFSSRAFDRFKISANKYSYFRDNIEHDWSFFEDQHAQTGTRVEMILSRDTERSLRDLFINHQDEGLAFVKTDILVDLSKFYGERLISRSQAKRVTRNLEKFTHITLDFKNIQAVGQGFVDQVFRVYAQQNPHMTIQYINANDDVTFMIKRGIANSVEK